MQQQHPKKQRQKSSSEISRNPQTKGTRPRKTGSGAVANSEQGPNDSGGFLSHPRKSEQDRERGRMSTGLGICISFVLPISDLNNLLRSTKISTLLAHGLLENA